MVLSILSSSGYGFVRSEYLKRFHLPGLVGQAVLDHLIASGRVVVDQVNGDVYLGSGVPFEHASSIPVLPIFSLQSVSFQGGVQAGFGDAFAVVCGGVTTFMAVGISFVFGNAVQEIPLPTYEGGSQFEIVYNPKAGEGPDPTLAMLEADAIIFKLLISSHDGGSFILSVRYARAKSAIIYYRFFSVETA